MNGDLLKTAIVILMAGAGTLARILNQSDKKSFQAFHTLSACFVGMFIGAIVYFMSKYFDIDSNLSYIIAGLCGWAGPQSLDVLTSLISAKTNINLKPYNKNDSN